MESDRIFALPTGNEHARVDQMYCNCCKQKVMQLFKTQQHHQVPMSSGFLVPQGIQKNADRIDVDGLPHVGAVIYPKQGYYIKIDSNSGTSTLTYIESQGGITVRRP